MRRLLYRGRESEEFKLRGWHGAAEPNGEGLELFGYCETCTSMHHHTTNVLLQHIFIR